MTAEAVKSFYLTLGNVLGEVLRVLGLLRVLGILSDNKSITLYGATLATDFVTVNGSEQTAVNTCFHYS
jgi:hypothetical protein